MSRDNIPYPTCSGICKQYQAKSVNGNRYAVGQKRCQMCLKWIYYEGSRCPCCKYRLRTHSRSARAKNKLGLNRI